MFSHSRNSDRGISKESYIKELGDDIRNYENYSDQYKVYYASKTIAWDYTQDRPYKGDTITADRRMYLHL